VSACQRVKIVVDLINHDISQEYMCGTFSKYYILLDQKHIMERMNEVHSFHDEQLEVIKKLILSKPNYTQIICP